jgi:CxxC-x17-CxxC domain-containing protein
MDEQKIKQYSEELAKMAAMKNVAPTQLRHISLACKKSPQEAVVKIRYQIGRNVKGFSPEFGEQLLKYREELDDESFTTLVKWTVMQLDYFKNNKKEVPVTGKRHRYEAKCSKCGTSTTVPFIPEPDRPVFCQNCFRQRN